jgi:hypothetical protein
MSLATGRLRTPLRRFLVALVGLVPALTSVSAQKVTSSRWSMQDARGGFCIWYLIDPVAAPSLVEKGTMLAAAGTGSTLPTALAQTIRDEPRFTSWIPAAICIGFYGSVTIDDEKPVLASSDQPIAIVTHLIAAQSPRGAGGASYLLVKLASDNRVVRNQAGDRGVSVEGITLLSGKDRGTPEDRVDLRLESTNISWVGHPSGDPSVGTTRSMSFGYAGARSINWQGSLQTTPAETHLMVGALRIEGKSPLAKALKASPIRPTGPIERGGTAQLVFQQVSPRGSGGN